MRPGVFSHLYRFANTLLLAALVVLGASGILMLYIERQPWIFDLHRMTGFSLLFLAPWKAIIVYRSLVRGLRKTFDRSVVVVLSLTLALFVVTVVVLSLMWMLRLGPYSILLQSLIAWHWILGFAMLPFLAVHVWRRWPRPTRADFLTRRGFLKLLGVAAGGVVAGPLFNRLAFSRYVEDSPRRFTGSHASGIFSGNAFPVVGEAVPDIDLNRWRLSIGGAVNKPLVLEYRDILARSSSVRTETLDCTNGWYSIQDWQGIALIDLLAEAELEAGPAGVRMVSETGYNHTYPFEEARRILLATHVTGEALEPRHGFPLRAVAPGRRGWFWVKWLARVEVLSSPWEVAGGIIASPREVLRQW